MQIDFENYTKMKDWGKSHRNIYYSPPISWDKEIYQLSSVYNILVYNNIPVIFSLKIDKGNITASLHEPLL